jgi:uncharacterized damage-inducible protein DinB
MNLVEELIQRWTNVRKGLIGEVNQIPKDQFSFRGTAETRTIEEMIKHIVTFERVLIREQCRENANLGRRPFPEHIAEHAPHVATTQGKEALVTLLNNSIDESMQVVRQLGEEGLKQDTRHFDGSTLSKFSFFSFVMSHEMYHRGQIALCERMLGIEPELTHKSKHIKR